jgi:methylmalonyl-CoA/ethylmalonyl-CoA epimerase
VNQVGIVVEDLNQALDAYHGVGPWAVWTYDRSTVPGLHDSEGPANFRFRIALNNDDPQIELIEPLDDHSLYAHWLADGHGGLHHLGYLVDNLAIATEAMEAAGFTVLAGGRGNGADGSGGFCYYDTIEAIGYIAEAIERPRCRRLPDFTCA